MNWITKMEQKWYRFAIPNLMKYIIGVMIAGMIVGYMNRNFYYNYLSLDPNAILSGQVWRVFTFVLCPSPYISVGSFSIVDLLFFAIAMYFYYWIGTTLERAWGAFRFQLFYMTGLFLIVVVGFIYYFINGTAYTLVVSGATNLEYLNQIMFVVFAMRNPDVQILLYFVIPIKVKWMAMLSAAFMTFQMIQNIGNTYGYIAYLFAAAVVTFLLFFRMGGAPARPYHYVKSKVKKARPQRESAPDKDGARHRCCVCGKTELDDPTLEFRYCSKCKGDHEYCSEHLFTHVHK